MRIGIDARCIESKRTGLGRYLINLLQEWAVVAPEHKYLLYFKASEATDDFLEQECFEKIVLSSRFLPQKGILFQQLLLPWDSLSRNLDVFFAPAYTAPLLVRSKLVVSIHDLIFELAPDSIPPIDRWFERIFARLSAHRATAIITDSKASADDIVRLYGIQRTRVGTIPLACAPIFRILDERSALQQIECRYGIDSRRTVLYVGSIFERRNVPRLLKAFRGVREEVSDVCLVLVGTNLSYPHIDLRAIISELRLEEDVIYLGRIEDDDLVSLYNKADVFVYPSFHEGFGLPMLEAMACGTPVITSNRSSLSEVAGDAAFLIDPYDEDQMRKAITNVLLDESLAQDLRHKGLERVRDFSWRRTAVDTLRIIQKVAKCEAGIDRGH